MKEILGFLILGGGFGLAGWGIHADHVLTIIVGFVIFSTGLEIVIDAKIKDAKREILDKTEKH